MGLTPKQPSITSKLTYEQIDEQLKNLIKSDGDSTSFFVSDLSMPVDELQSEALKNGYVTELISDGTIIEFH